MVINLSDTRCLKLNLKIGPADKMDVKHWGGAQFFFAGQVRYLRAHLMPFIVLFLIGVWLSISWLVYRAEVGVPGANITSYAEGVWWGIVTFLTVGYGDRFPTTVEGRIMAGVLMVAGVAVTGIVTAKISSYFLEQVLRQGRGFVDTNRLKNHFVVCGCKEDMHELLIHILDFNPDLKPDQLVLVANVGQVVVDAFREHPRLKTVQVLVGDFSQEIVLRRAAPERARKVLILADRTVDEKGHVPGLTEVDARTIMTAMTLSSIARGTLVAAEILDPKMDQYLKLASVSEVLYTRQYGRLLLGNASVGTGITNIIFDLLNPKTPTRINTHKISDESVNSPYEAFKISFEKKNRGCVVIGILENTGNTHLIKEMALRQAQKTPDIGRLVKNLRSVKEIRCNYPILNPDGAYIIPHGSMAIVIENRQDIGGEASATRRAA